MSHTYLSSATEPGASTTETKPVSNPHPIMVTGNRVRLIPDCRAPGLAKAGDEGTLEGYKFHNEPGERPRYMCHVRRDDGTQFVAYSVDLEVVA